MIVTQLQWDSHRGPDVTGAHKLTFSMDESLTSDFDVMKYKKGTQFTVIFLEGQEEREAFVSETPEETRTRFFKQFHAVIGEIAVLKGHTNEEQKNIVRDTLKREGLIKESTTELSTPDLAAIIIRLKKQKNELQH